jgi:cytochrome oxidase assembly protein ShyY1
MKTQTAEEPASTIKPEEVQEALDRILSSKYFVNAHKKKEFLRLICDFHLKGRASELNEYILGYEVFARDNAYNPSGDPIVRVFAHEIRKKLENYYKTEGSHDPIRLAIPAGTYQPVFTRQVADTTTTPQEARTTSETLIDTTPKTDVERGRHRLSPGVVWMSLAVLCLAIAVVSLVMSNSQLRQKVSEAEASRDTATNGEDGTIPQG